MASITVTPALVRPLEGARIVRYTAGEELTPGQAVYVSAASTVSKADGSAVATLLPFAGIVIGDAYGNTTIPSGNKVDVCEAGRIAGPTGMTAAALVYVSDTGGEITHAAGEATKDLVVGFAESTTILNVRPQVVDWS